MNRISGWMRCISAVAILAIAMGAAHAQDATTGSISGTVTDSTGALVKGATVTVINTDRNHVERTVTTSSAGTYTANALPLGVYTVKISDAGFKTSSVTGLTLHVDDSLTVNRALSAGDATESITVTADALHVNLEDATSAGLINGNQIKRDASEHA